VISAAVVNYETRADLRACLSALQGDEWSEIVVVDNASTDGSAAMVEAEFPQAKLIRNEENLGFGAAANQALRTCSSEYVLLLNGDTQPDAGAGGALAAYLAGHPRAAIVGPRLLNVDGTLQPSCFPFLTPWRAALVMSGLNAVVAAVPPLAHRHLPTTPHDRPRIVPWVKGAAVAVRRAAVVGAGGFDERFFMYGEEAELSYRLREIGWETHFAPVASVVHREHASTPGGRAQVQLHVCRGLVRFYRLHYSRRCLAELRLVLGVLMLGRLARDRLVLLRERDPGRRADLDRSIAVWSAILRGRFDDPEAQPSRRRPLPA
jgi:GT2 family glycosyltransferase